MWTGPLEIKVVGFQEVFHCVIKLYICVRITKVSRKTRKLMHPHTNITGVRQKSLPWVNFAVTAFCRVPYSFPVKQLIVSEV